MQPGLPALSLCALLTGCAPGPALVDTPKVANPPRASSETVQQIGSPFGDPTQGPATFSYPLLLDRTDLALGTMVQFNRIPNTSELNDLHSVYGLRSVVVTLPAWPLEYGPLDPLNQMPSDAELIIVLSGYPPSRGAAEAWNMLGVRERIIVVVNTPPPSSAVIVDLNSMRGLERVIYQTDNPDRRGFERLQRPLSFRTLRE